MSLHLVLAAVGLAAPAHASDSWAFRILADTGADFTEFAGTPVLNCHADAAFLAATPDGAGLFLAGDGDTIPIHQTSNGVDLYGQPEINDAGTLVFYYEPAKSNSTNTGRARLMVGDATALVDVTDGMLRLGTRGAINNFGSVAYIGNDNSGRNATRGIYIDNGQQTRALLESRQEILHSFGSNGIAVNDHGMVVFDGTLNDGRDGLFAATANGLATLVDASSGIDRFLSATVNNDGDVAFFGYVKIAEKRYKPGLYLLRNGELEAIGGERYGLVFGSPNLNDAGAVAFMARVDSDAEVGIYVGPDPGTHEVIVRGELVAGRQVSALHLGRNALNNAGQIIFLAEFADGGQGIVLASPAVEGLVATADCPRAPVMAPLPIEARHDEIRELLETIGPSSWLEDQKERFAGLLSADSYDVLVAPFQPDGDTLDAVGRSMLARRLAESLERAGYRVADPGLVEKALGEPARYVSPDDILELGKKVGVRAVVLGYVGHDRHHRLHIRLDVWEEQRGTLSLRSPKQQLEWPDIPFSDIELPYKVFGPLADEAASQIAGRDPRSRRTGRFEIGGYASLPGSVDELVERAAGSPLDEAWQLAFIGTLFPRSIDSRSRDHLFERALVALERVAQDSPGRAILEARALMALERRPAAVAALGNPATAEGEALLAYLNSDLPRLGAAVEKIQGETARLMAEIDLRQLRYLYGMAFDEDRAEAILEGHPVWGPFLSQRLVDGDPWGRGSNALTKIGLDILVPGVFATLEQYSEGQLTQAAWPAEPDIAGTVIDHIRAGYDLSAPAALVARRDQNAPHQADILELAQAVVLRNAIDSSRVERGKRGRPDVAVRNLAEYERLFLDNPQFTIEAFEARLAGELRDGLTTQQREQLRAEAIELGRKGFFWSGRQIATTPDIGGSPERWFPEARAMDATTRAAVFYTHDFPSRSGPHVFSPDATTAERRAAAKHCLDYTLSDLSCALFYQQSLLEESPPRRTEAEAVLASLDHRFVGHPRRTDFIARMRRQMGDSASEEAVYEQAIAEQTSSWRPYSIIGSKLVSENRYTEARDTYLKYPGFTRRGLADPVALSNHAYEGGSRLYWVGAWEAARPLYEISASLDVGSGASLESASRLALLEQNWERAMYFSLLHARRYRSAYAYRDYMALLHFRGRSEESWALFDNLINDGMDVQIWTAAYLGHRMNGATLPEIIDWATSGAREYTAARERWFIDRIVRYIVLVNVVDRLPAADLGAIIRRLNPRFDSSDGQTGRMLTDPDTGHEFAELYGHTRTLLTAEALAAFYHGDMARAQSLLEDVGSLRDLNEFLPHYTIAALASGDTARLERYLDVAPERYNSLAVIGSSDPRPFHFYDRLALALVAGYQDDHDAAIDHLTRALNYRPFTEYRTIFTYYQILETCEHLYEKSGEDAYRDLGYRLAKRFQRVQPMYPWAYVFAARLAPTAVARIPDLAAAMWLDPGSLRVSQMSQEERNAAEEWLENYGSPFNVVDGGQISASLL